MTRRVLVVDFDEASLNATVELLRAQGLDVEPAGSTDQLERALTTSVPEIAIVEPALGQADSYELCSMIRQATGGTQRLILASSRLRGEALRFRAGEVGAELFFERPMNDAHLVDAIVDAVRNVRGSDSRTSAPQEPSIAARAIANLKREPANTSLELTDIDNSTFEGWIDDVFAEIEGDDEQALEAEAEAVEEPTLPPLQTAAESVFARGPEPQCESEFLGAPLDGEEPHSATTMSRDSAEELQAAASALAPLEAATDFELGLAEVEAAAAPTPPAPEPAAAQATAPARTPAPPTPRAPSIPAAGPGTIPLARPVAPAGRRKNPPAPRSMSAPRARVESSAAAALQGDSFATHAPAHGLTRLIFPIAALLVLSGGAWWGWQHYGPGAQAAAAAEPTAAPAAAAELPAPVKQRTESVAKAVPVAVPETAAPEPDSVPISLQPLVPLEIPTGIAAEIPTGQPAAAASAEPGPAAAEPAPVEPAAAEPARRVTPQVRTRPEPALQAPIERATRAASIAPPQAEVEALAEPEPLPAEPTAQSAVAAAFGSAQPASTNRPAAREVAAKEPRRAPALDLRGTLGLSTDVDVPTSALTAERNAATETTTPEPASPIRPTVVAPVVTLVQPRLLPDTRVQPTMTAVAERLGIGGLVVLRAMVLRDGSVGEIEIVEEPPRLGLGKAAARAVRRWRYEPALQNGEAIETSVRVEILFEPG